MLLAFIIYSCVSCSKKGLRVEGLEFSDEDTNPTNSSQHSTPNHQLSTLNSGDVTLSIKECIALALKNNPDVKIKEIVLRQSEHNVEGSKGTFDPLLSIDSKHGKSKTPTNYFFQSGGATSTLSDYYQYIIGIGGETPIGLDYKLSLDSKRDKTSSTAAIFNPSWANTASLELRYPLLRGHGSDYAQVAVTLAINKQKLEDYNFRRSLEETIFDTESAYWGFVLAVEELVVKNSSLTAAKKLLDDNREKVKAGTKPKIEELRAEVRYTEYLEDIASQELKVSSARDNLYKLIKPIEEPTRTWASDIMPVGKPSFEKKTVDIDALMDSVLANRFDYLALQKEVEEKDILLDKAVSEKKPKLEAYTKGSYGGLDGGASESYRNIEDRTFPTLEGGFVFEYPILNRSASSAAEIAELERRIKTIQLHKLERDIFINVRESVRGLETAERRLNSAKKSVETAELALKAEDEGFKAGLVDSRRLLDAEDDLARAKVRELKALIDYHIGYLRILKAAGKLLVEYDLKD